MRGVDRDAPPIRWQTLPPWVNRLIWRMGLPIIDALIRGTINRCRAQLGLAPVDHPVAMLAGCGIALAADRELAPLPPDAPSTVVQTDAWILDDPVAPALQKLDAPMGDERIVTASEQTAEKPDSRRINSPDFVLLPGLIFGANGLHFPQDFGMLGLVDPPPTPVEGGQLLNQDFYLGPYGLPVFAQGTDQAAVFPRGFATLQNDLGKDAVGNGIVL